MNSIYEFYDIIWRIEEWKPCGFSHMKRIPGDQEFEKFQVSS